MNLVCGRGFLCSHVHGMCVYYILCVCVCTEKDRLQMKYEDRVQLLAYYKQEKYGSYSSDKDNDVGYFDVVGRDRR